MSNSNPFGNFDPAQWMEQAGSAWQQWQEQYAQWSRMTGSPTAPNPFAGFGASPFGAASPFGGAMPGGFGMGSGMPFGFGAAFAPRDPLQDAMRQFGGQGAQWLASLQQMASEFLDKAPSAKAIREQWEQWLEQAGGDGFNRMFSAMQQFNHQDFSVWLTQVQPVLDWMRAQAGGAGDVPAFGFMREHQERWQQLARFVQEYRDAAAQFSTLLGTINTDALDRFESALEARREQGKVIESTRALFDVWVDAAEAAFEEAALGDEYRAAYGDLVNSQMRVRLAVQSEIERATAAFGIPGRTEIDAAYRKLTMLEREVRNLRDALRTGSVPTAAVSTAGAPPAKVATKAMRKAVKKAAKKAVKKAAKKVAKSVAKKATKKVAKKAATKSVAKKAAKKTVSKKATARKTTRR